ncbi:MAG: hypothetical protein KBD01_07705 [Acidobacteria bacterium]|nr:hypothetical protein [Acidobacteriota bacterium]
MARPSRMTGLTRLAALAAACGSAALAILVARGAPAPAVPPWLDIDYGTLVDRRELSHSGETVGQLLRALGGRPVPAGDARPEDRRAHVLLEPLLEPYAFVLPDALDAIGPVPDPPLVEIGALYPPGSAEPAWADLLRSRRFVVESDGRGRVRVFAPWSGDPARAASAAASAEASRAAFDGAWPILRHALAAEQRRLGGRPLEVETRAYVHEPARSLFRLATGAHRRRVEATGPGGSRAPLDLAALRRFLARGDRLEGARLDGDGTLRLLGSEGPGPATLLGRPLALADLAVAYRAVFHGGLGEPYMSLDRDHAPQRSLVTYGGRLRDTGLGLVSLSSDIRFKTFSLGLDITTGRDLRDDIRAQLPGFRTHLERFAADPASQGVLGQQTRLWFYPDQVDLTLSAAGDVLVVRRARMSAASERLGAAGAAPADPPWTRAIVDAVNADYDALARMFPELGELDQLARLLALFAWLKQAEAAGLAVPELDALLALELPAEPTPRVFPQLLAFNALPPVGAAGAVDVLDQVPVGEALDRLAPAPGRPLPAARRLRRALAALDERSAEQAATAREVAAAAAGGPPEDEVDLLATRAERARMRQLVLASLAPDLRRRVLARESAGEHLRVFGLGIGGVDLGMGQALARARGRDQRISLGGIGRPAGPAASDAPRPAASSPAPRPEWGRDPDGLPAPVLPAHGLEPAAAVRRDGALERAVSVFPGGWVARGSHGTAAGAVRWTEVVTGALGPDARSRRVIAGAQGPAREIERVESGRWLRYRVELRDARATVVAGGDGLPVPAALALAPPRAPAEAGPVPAALALLEVVERDPGAGSGPEAPVTVRLRGAGGADVTAPMPRPVLERLVLGHAADVTPDKPLPGFSRLPPGLDAARTVMALADPRQVLPPWSGEVPPLAGEEDPLTLGRALADWWASDPEPRAAVAGVDPARSPARWEAAPRPGPDALLLLPDGAFPPPWGVLADEIRRAWRGASAPALPEGPLPPLVLLLSAEAPDAFAARAARVAADPRMRGKLLAAWPLAAPCRQDLPARLLEDGNLAGFGLAAPRVAGRSRVPQLVGAFGRGLAAAAGARRVEQVPSPFFWFF